MAIDPVCGMEVDPTTAKYKTEYKGKTYYFCSAHCKKVFEDNPEKYLKHTGSHEMHEHEEHSHHRCH